MFVNAVEWAKLPQVRYKKDGGEYKCRTHGVAYSECRLHHCSRQLVPLTLMPEDLVLWKRNAVGLAARYAWYVREYGERGVGAVSQMPMEGTFSAGCKWCEFKRFCLSGRRPELVESMLVAREPRRGE